jgi:hypothetical protein
MRQEQDIHAFSQLGMFLKQFNPNGVKNPELSELNEEFYDSFEQLINRHIHFNGWFSKEFIQLAISELSEGLKKENLQSWLKDYSYNDVTSKKIFVIMASNLPLVEFHDFISVLLTGHVFYGKCSDQNKHMLPFLSKILIKIDSSFSDRVFFVDAPFKDFDAVIATGSNNSARYFEYYFKNKPSIIRKNRTSLAVLNEDSSKEDFKNLGKDITYYFGRGCRSITKIFLPKGTEINEVFEGLFDYQQIINNNKYGNNYDYHRAVMLMNQEQFLDNGFLLLKENSSIHTPVSVVHYEYYSDQESLKKELDSLSSEIQCIVSNTTEFSSIPLGHSQKPKWNDYADGVDTIDFLLNL